MKSKPLKVIRDYGIHITIGILGSIVLILLLTSCSTSQEMRDNRIAYAYDKKSYGEKRASYIFEQEVSEIEREYRQKVSSALQAYSQAISSLESDENVSKNTYRKQGASAYRAFSNKIKTLRESKTSALEKAHTNYQNDLIAFSSGIVVSKAADMEMDVLADWKSLFIDISTEALTQAINQYERNLKEQTEEEKPEEIEEDNSDLPPTEPEQFVF